MKKSRILILFFIVTIVFTSTAFSQWNIDIERLNNYRSAIGQHRIRMLLYPDYKGKIVGNYYFEDQLVKIKLAGIMLVDRVEIFEYDTQGNQKGAFTGKISEDGARFAINRPYSG